TSREVMLMERRIFPMAMVGPLVAVTIAITSGCSATNGGSKDGELGNGGFYFSCNDAVACTPYSNDAAKFPKAVSLGSTFTVRFVPKPISNSLITFNDKAPD